MNTLFTKITVATFASMALWACHSGEGKTTNSEESSSDEAAIAVEVVSVTQRDYSETVISSGLITTETEAKLSFKTGGIVSTIAVKEGASVRKGQVLATLIQTEIDAQVVQARNNEEKLKRDLDRITQLYRDSAATLEQLQNIQTAYDAAHETHRITSFNKEYSVIRATTNGRVIRKFVNEGELVSSGAPVLLINAAGQNEWIARVGLPDVDWVRLQPGDRAHVITDAYPDEKFDAVVSLISEGADPVNGLYSVELKIDTQGKRFASGLFARVYIYPSTNHRVWCIPIEAIVEGTGKNAFVFVLHEDQKHVRKIPVKVHAIAGDEVLIKEGLEEYNEVITAGSAFLTALSRVQLIKH